MILKLRKISPVSNYSFIWKRFASFSSSKRWIDRQSNDKFSQTAKSSNYRSRAAFKLIKLDDKFKLFNKNCKTILDLGFAPGAWTQVAIERTSKNKDVKILGIDLIKCTPPKGSHFLQGDIFNNETQNKILKFFDVKGIEGNILEPNVDFIMSDMMANTSGNKDADHFASMDLCTEVLKLSDKLLKFNGNLVMKFFTGKEDSLIQKQLEARFKKVYRFKPEASRNESKEMFFVGIKKLKNVS